MRVNKYLLAKDCFSIIRATHENVNTTWAVSFPDDANNFFDPDNIPFIASQQLGCPWVHRVVNADIAPVEEPVVEEPVVEVDIVEDASEEAPVEEPVVEVDTVEDASEEAPVEEKVMEVDAVEEASEEAPVEEGVVEVDTEIPWVAFYKTEGITIKVEDEDEDTEKISNWRPRKTAAYIRHTSQERDRRQNRHGHRTNLGRIT
jgi:hypothetical protein